MVTAGKRKPELERDFDELRRGITNVPALLQGVADRPLAEFSLNHYEISPVEPLHDLKGHLSNIIDEIKVLVTGPAKQRVNSICSSVLAKERLRGSDYRKGAILILLALQESQPRSPLTVVLETAVEICEILYSGPEKRTPKTVLRLHNLTFVHAKLCAEVFGTPKTMTKRKMFGRYFHALTAHSPLVNRIISLCLLNTEVEERMFGQCKQITRSSSNQHTNHIITNILVRLKCEEQRKERATSIVHKQESEVSKLAQSLPPKKNILIPRQWIENTPIHYQAHLERMGDYLLQGPGIWWRYVDVGVEFFDIETPSSHPPTPSLHHFRTTSLSDVDMYLLTKWEKCLEENVQLPAKYIRTYAAGGNVSELRSCSSGFYTLSLTPCTTTGTEQPVLHSSPPLTPCMTTGTKQPVLHSSPPLTPCMTTGTKQPVLHSSPPLTPCTSTGVGTEQPVLHSSPPLTPCTSTGTEQSVLHSSPPLTPCTSTGTKQPVLHSSPPSLPVRLQAQSSPCCTRLPPHSLYVYRHRAAHAALESPPHSLYDYRHRAVLPVQEPKNHFTQQTTQLYR